MRDDAADAIDSVFEEFGTPAIYWPAAGGALPVTAIAHKGSSGRGIFHANIVSNVMMLRVRVAEVPSPVAGDQLEINGQVRLIQGVPTTDSFGLVWILDTAPPS